MISEILPQAVEPLAAIAITFLLPFLLDKIIRVTKAVPQELRLMRNEPGIFFGTPLKDTDGQQFYAGRPMRAEGHVLCSGGPGSGKTRHMVMNTVKTWAGLQVVLAIKGGLADFCTQVAHRTGRDVWVFSPMKQNGDFYYDPFIPVRRDSANIAGHMWDIAVALIPDTGAENQKVWTSAAQNFLAGALAYYYSLSKSFVEAIQLLSAKPVFVLVDEIMERGGPAAKGFVGSLQGVQEPVLQNIGLELNSLARFCSIPAVYNALNSKGRKCLDWYAFGASKRPTMVVLDFPETSLDQCEPLYRLIVNQLIKALETRPERTYNATEALPVLVQADEFARLGKVPAIIHGLSTLRSRGVSFALYIQSLANLDSIYGVNGAREIRDNCTYHVVLNAMDVASQRYLSDMVGTAVYPTLSTNISAMPVEENSVPAMCSSIQVGTERQPAVRPELFRYLKTAIISSPYGVFQVGKDLPGTYGNEPIKQSMPQRPRAIPQRRNNGMLKAPPKGGSK